MKSRDKANTPIEPQADDGDRLKRDALVRLKRLMARGLSLGGRKPEEIERRGRRRSV